MANTQLTISLFGDFNLTWQGQSSVSFSGDRPISLLAYLLLHRQTAVSRQQLAFTLWPDSSDSQARANLRNLFYTLRQTLPNADTYLAADSMTLQWRTDA
ncbi:MAG: winged helix-turn-helix domain-containing protein, partial [Ardenticatenaceae bacterium]|nr:winged helix-turn-helix domain-containing protein [Ardenticatenaceae bacterium]